MRADFFRGVGMEPIIGVRPQFPVSTFFSRGVGLAPINDVRPLV